MAIIREQECLMRKLAIVLPAFVLLSPFAAAQDPLQLLKKVAASYAALPKTSYDFERVEVREYRGAIHNRTEQRRRIVGSPGKVREEALPAGILYLFDGQYRWAYNPDREEFTKTSASAATAHAASLSMFELVAYRVKDVRFLRQETLQLASGPVVCQVIEVEREPTDDRTWSSPTTYWIDASRNLVLKSQYGYVSGASGGPGPENSVTVSFTKAVVGQPVDESLFRFPPPADAVQVERLTFGPKSTLVGKDTPDFELKGVDGKPISAASLRGHTVLLQFSRGSDDDSLFFLEMTYRSLRGNGLTAMFVLPSRNQPGTGTEAYTVPVATDPDGSAAKKFGIPYAGTVLIDRLGKIAYIDAASRNTLELARALQKAGVW